MNEQSDRDERLHKLIGEALSSAESAGDDDIERLLDAADVEPLNDDEIERILAAAMRPHRTPVDPAVHPALAARGGGAAAFSNNNSIANGAAMKNLPSMSALTDSHRNGATGGVIAVAVCAMLAVGVLISIATQKPDTADENDAPAIASFHDSGPTRMVALPRPKPVAVGNVAVGARIETKRRERKRLRLPDGSILYVNENTRVDVVGERLLKLSRGEVFVEVDPRNAADDAAKFVIQTPDRQLTALGTKFDVKADDSGTGLLVTQGTVKVSGVDRPVRSGQELRNRPAEVAPARRASEALHWTKDLMAAAETPLVPASKFAGGALVAIDPNGQETRLTLRKFHVDVHIEDGFARTTIDQTYFNNTWGRLEGTFYFPLPADASLSRLAMYVGETLMEGGMCERDRARNVFEQIVHTSRDPALLEWVDGSTFKMRVFPLEARQEKRIVLSYTQRLGTGYGRTQYRFPAGHSLELVRDWSTRIRVKHGAKLPWHSSSHDLKATRDGDDLLLEADAQAVAIENDIVVDIDEGRKVPRGEDDARVSTALHEGQRYLMLRFRPHLRGKLKRPRRNWVFLFETSGDRNPLIARTQIDVIKTLLNNAEHDDTFAIVTAATRVKTFAGKPLAATRANIDKAVKFLEQSHLIGAFDFGKALSACRPFYQGRGASHLVHVGSAIAALGEKKEETLLAQIPKQVRYVGVGVGKRWSRQFMKGAAGRTGGLFTQINPDEKVGWRAFDLLSTLNAPRLVDVKVTDGGGKPAFLNFAESLAQGEELCAITRTKAAEALPKTLVVTGTLNRQPYRRTIAVKTVAKKAAYLPRTWARLEIDRLVAAGAEKNKPAIIALSKAMYVMSPFTSLLVLENEAMYKQYNVDRGRKDHWALYPAPEKIKVVYEPTPAGTEPRTNGDERRKILESILVHTRRSMFHSPIRLGPNVDYILGARTAFDINSFASGARAEDNVPVFGWNSGRVNLNTVQGVKFDPAIMPDFDVDPAAVYLDINQPFHMRPGSNGFVPMVATRHIDISDLLTYRARIVSNRSSLLTRPQWNLATYRLNLANIDRQYETDFSELVPGLNAELARRLFVSESAGRSEGSWLPSLRIRLGMSRDETGLVPDTAIQWQSSDVWQAIKGRRMKWASSAVNDAYAQNTMRLLRGGNEAILNNHFFMGRLPATEWGQNADLIRQIGYPLGEAASYFRPPPLRTLLRTIAINRSAFGDLVARAPGMNTSVADVLATLDRETSAASKAATGQIDPRARRLFERARSRGWESITLAGRQGEPALNIVYDAQGRYRYQRIVSEGLRERVVCDGKTLWHLYDEIGIGARRRFSRFHWAELHSLVPWLLPAVDEFARGADVTLIDRHTVAIVPLRTKTNGKHAKNVRKHRRVALHLVFADDGRLVERRWVELPSGKTLLRQTMAADGTVKLFDADGKLVVERNLHRAMASAPNLEPATKQLVVLPLPFRSSKSVLKTVTIPEDKDYSKLSDRDALALIASDLGSGNMQHFLDVINRKYLARGDRRIGLQVLIASRYQNLLASNVTIKLSPVPGKRGSALDEFLRQQVEWCRSGNDATEFVIRGPETGFVQRLARARNIFLRWSTGRATKDRTQRQVEIELERDLKFIQSCRSPSLGWTLLNEIQKSVKHPELLRHVAQASKRFEDEPGVAFLARHERARALFAAGQSKEARNVYGELFLKSVEAGFIPLFDLELFAAFRKRDGTQQWRTLLRKAQSVLLARKQLRMALALSWDYRQMRDPALADELLEAVLKQTDANKRPDIVLSAVIALWQLGRFDKAEALLKPLLNDDRFAKVVGLWRLAADIADKRHRLSESLSRLERAMELEFAQTPDVVNLQTVRAHYAELLSRYEKLVDASATLEAKPPRDLLPRVVRFADRWRALDTDDTAACQLAARIARKLGARDLAWDYLMTPVALNPNEAAPWLDIATTLAGQNEIDLADRAYTHAFAAESTNAQILWNHHELLRKHRRFEEARGLLQRVVEGTWQPRFRPVQAAARQALGVMGGSR